MEDVESSNERRIVSYITFDCSESFEEWQKTAVSAIQIINVVPVLQNMEINQLSAKPDVGVFVTYLSQQPK